jgi:hypothetical protein
VARPKKQAPVALFVALAVILVASLGAGIYFFASSNAEPAKTAAAPAAEKKKTPAPDPKETEEDEEPPKKEEKKTPGSVAKSAGVSIDEPNVVGDLDQKEIRRVLKKALPEMEECRRATDEHVMAAVHVHPVGKITLAGVAPDNKGNEAAARCVAQRFKEAAAGWKQGADDSGIIFFEVTLKAK